MSETRVLQGEAVFAEIGTSSQVPMAGLAYYLENLDSLYRILRSKVVQNSAELYHLEEFIRDGRELTGIELLSMQMLLDEMWSELLDGFTASVGHTTYTVTASIPDRDYMDPLDHFGLNIASISMQSPITLTFDGVWPVLLIVAAIFSGGTITMGSLKIKLPPIGTGVEALRRALGKPGTLRPPRPPRIRDSIER